MICGVCLVFLTLDLFLFVLLHCLSYFLFSVACLFYPCIFFFTIFPSVVLSSAYLSHLAFVFSMTAATLTQELSLQVPSHPSFHHTVLLLGSHTLCFFAAGVFGLSTILLFRFPVSFLFIKRVPIYFHLLQLSAVCFLNAYKCSFLSKFCCNFF